MKIFNNAKRKYKKNLIITAILTSSILATNIANSYFIIRSLNTDRELTETFISHHIITPKHLKEIVIASTATAFIGYISYISIKAYNAYQEGLEQYKVLKEFQENTNYTYENLKTNAENLYFIQCKNPSTKSIDIDYPVMWLIDQTTKNAKYLTNFFFLSELNMLAEKLNKKLTYLRNHPEFKKDKKEYSDKKRVS